MVNQIDTIKQAYEVSLRQMQTLLAAQSRLRAVAEEIADQARRELERAAEALCPEWVDEASKASPLGLANVSPSDLASAIIQDVKRRLTQANSHQPPAETAENARLREENARLCRENAQLRLRISVLEKGARTSDSDPDAPAALPDWVAEWQAEPSYDRDLALLRILAETGAPRWTDAAALFEEQVGKDRDSGTALARSFANCQRRGLVEVVEAQSVTGATAHLVHLTPQGRDICQPLLGMTPAPGADTLIARHASPSDAALVLEAADLLREAGYQVSVLPDPIPLPDGRAFTPDLVATLADQAAVVTVQSGIVTEERPTRDDWIADLHSASHGELHIVTPDRETMDLIRSDVMYWISQHKQAGPTNLRITNITAVRDDKSKKETIWLMDRDYNQAKENDS